MVFQGYQYFFGGKGFTMGKTSDQPKAGFGKAWVNMDTLKICGNLCDYTPEN